MLSINTSRSSPNFSSRNGHPIRMLVMHASAGSFTSALNWLCAPASHVSSHFLIAKNGAIYGLVDEKNAAWHAGVSSWPGFVSCNDESIGIELANLSDGVDPYPPAQLAAARALGTVLIAHYPIAPVNIVRHLDIAPGRKSDPAQFPDWPGFVASLYPPAPIAYRVMGAPVFESSTRTGTLWGRLTEGEHVIVDTPEGHLQDGRGFIRIDPDTLEKL